MTTTEATGDHAGGEHTSRWPLVTAVGAGVLGVVGGLAGWLREAFLADYWARAAGETGVYCAELCGTGHSRMQGTVVVLNGTAYDRWVERRRGEGPARSVTAAETTSPSRGAPQRPGVG